MELFLWTVFACGTVCGKQFSEVECHGDFDKSLEFYSSLNGSQAARNHLTICKLPSWLRLWKQSSLQKLYLFTACEPSLSTGSPNRSIWESWGLAPFLAVVQRGLHGMGLPGSSREKQQQQPEGSKGRPDISAATHCRGGWSWDSCPA